MRMRVEHICFKAEIAFARRLPLSEKVVRKAIMSAARRQLERDPIIWTEVGRLEHDMEMFRKMGSPPWVVALLKRWALKRIRRAKGAQARAN
ncbi:MAG: hypothetical protein JWL77_2049 [Chthonomonadaceae bacterium]|nr:hypothetical protein [Chthonomonadaceae bacterium]